MAINKIVANRAKTHRELRSCIAYVLNEEKTDKAYMAVTGPFSSNSISVENVYKAFVDEKKLWNKDSGRMYMHSVLSFHKDENISKDEAFSIARDIAENDSFYKDYQTLVVLHMDRDHLHAHFVTNTVSFIDGNKEHHSKKDFQALMERTNKYCEAYGLSVTHRGKHFDGSQLKELDISSMNNKKLRVITNLERTSYVAECMLAVNRAKQKARSIEQFKYLMAKEGWNVLWSDNRKYITFIDSDGHKVRNCNLSKTFNIDLEKGDLINEFERNSERIFRAEDSGIFENITAKIDSVGAIIDACEYPIGTAAFYIIAAGEKTMRRASDQDEKKRRAQTSGMCY